MEMQKKRVLFRPRAALSPLDKLPVAVDNSKTKYFPPIIDQQGGSCAQASGVGYLFTYEMNRLLDRSARDTTANQFSYQFAWNLLNDGEDQGGFVDEGLELARNYGMMTVADYGYSSAYQYRWASGYDKYFRAMHFRAAEVYTFDDSIPLMKRYLYDAGDGSQTGGILVFSGQSSWAINNAYDGPSSTGYHSLLYRLGTSGSHAVTIAGYDDLVEYTDDKGVTHRGAFIVVNTWGTFSHDSGRFYLPYDFFRDPTVSALVLSNTVTGVKVKTYEPKVVAKIGLHFTSRNDLYFGVGFSDDASRAEPKRYFYDRTFDQKGGDYPMQGQYQSPDIEIALDLTPHLDSLSQTPAAYYLNVVRAFKGSIKGVGSVTSLSFIDYRGKEPVEYVYRGELPLQLNDGRNILRVPTRPRAMISASPVRYADEKGNLIDQTILLRTAAGNPAKLKFSNPNPQNKTVDLRFEVDKK